jgi:5-methylcytosine-specific restriction endonuclease McrA
VGKPVLPDTFVCEGCAETIKRLPPPERDTRTKYCSRACKLRVWWKSHDRKSYEESYRPSEHTILRRQILLAEKRKVKELEKARRREARILEKQERDRQRRQVPCRVCGLTFLKGEGKHGSGQQTLCQSCRGPELRRLRIVTQKRAREVYGRKPAERARKRGLPYERCGPIAICTRDKWRCQLCGVPTPRGLRGTYDDRAPEIDHIIPLSDPRSPGHVWSNVQCLCRRCNREKGAQTLGQLRLAV